MTRRQWATLAGLAAAIAIFIAVIPGKRGWFDVGVYYGTVHHWMQGGHLYDYVREGSHYGFTYPPFAAVCMLPMLLFTWHEAVAVNQSLHGVVARLAPAHARTALWLIAVLAVLVIWARRVRRADLAAGFAMTGVVACLISPITWVHHLVWLIPALVLLADSGTRRLTAVAAGMYAILCSRLVWLWALDHSGVDGFLGGNAYVWIGLSLLAMSPIATDLTNSVVSAPEPGMARTHP